MLPAEPPDIMRVELLVPCESKLELTDRGRCIGTPIRMELLSTLTAQKVRTLHPTYTRCTVWKNVSGKDCVIGVY